MSQQGEGVQYERIDVKGAVGSLDIRGEAQRRGVEADSSVRRPASGIYRHAIGGVDCQLGSVELHTELRDSPLLADAGVNSPSGAALEDRDIRGSRRGGRRRRWRFGRLLDVRLCRALQQQLVFLAARFVPSSTVCIAMPPPTSLP